MLLTSQRSGEIGTQLPGTDESDADKVEVLRQILIKQELREVGYSEAQEIGVSLIEFYQILAAEEACNDPEG
jgi:hypothetical protein